MRGGSEDPSVDARPRPRSVVRHEAIPPDPFQGARRGYAYLVDEPSSRLSLAPGVTFEGVFQEPGDARRWLKARLATHELAGMADDACLVVSELVTNSLTHGGGAPTVRATVARTGLRLEVSDLAPGLPEVRGIGVPDASGGLGLRIVEQLSSSWGVTPFGQGKMVWASLAPNGLGSSPGANGTS